MDINADDVLNSDHSPHCQICPIETIQLRFLYNNSEIDSMLRQSDDACSVVVAFLGLFLFVVVKTSQLSSKHEAIKSDNVMHKHLPYAHLKCDSVHQIKRRKAWLWLSATFWLCWNRMASATRISINYDVLNNIWKVQRHQGYVEQQSLWYIMETFNIDRQYQHCVTSSDASFQNAWLHIDYVHTL